VSDGHEPLARAGHELLEHTADLGIRAWGPTPERAFEQAAWGVVELLDSAGADVGESRAIAVRSTDRPGLLVEFLNELVFLLDTEDVAVTAIRIRRVTDTDLDAEIIVAPLVRRSEGIVVKAATYHGLAVAVSPEGWTEVRVYLDV